MSNPQMLVAYLDRHRLESVTIPEGLKGLAFILLQRKGNRESAVVVKVMAVEGRKGFE